MRQSETTPKFEEVPGLNLTLARHFLHTMAACVCIVESSEIFGSPDRQHQPVL
jgi:hypothetical protein